MTVPSPVHPGRPRPSVPERRDRAGTAAAAGPPKSGARPAVTAPGAW
ncbi:hypothetical protein ACIQI7_27210 [Kitasatospora sp. NPDC092039]